MLVFYLKRLLVIVLIVGIGVSYSMWHEHREASNLEKTKVYAAAVAKLAVAEALQHDNDVQGKPNETGWQEIKDSMLSSWNLSSDSIDSYVNSFDGQEEKLAVFWKQVRVYVDSLTELELMRLSPPIDTLVANSLAEDSLTDTTAILDSTEAE